MVDLLLRLALFLTLSLGLTACGSLGKHSGGAWIGNGTWILTELDGQPPLPRVTVTLSLEEGIRLFGSGGVNRYFGTFSRAAGDRFHTGSLAFTKRAGPADAQRQEARFLELLARSDSIRVDRAQLMLGQGAEGWLVFERGP